jgi:hypothetical protein
MNRPLQSATPNRRGSTAHTGGTADAHPPPTEETATGSRRPTYSRLAMQGEHPMPSGKATLGRPIMRPPDVRVGKSPCNRKPRRSVPRLSSDIQNWAVGAIQIWSPGLQRSAVSSGASGRVTPSGKKPCTCTTPPTAYPRRRGPDAGPSQPIPADSPPICLTRNLLAYPRANPTPPQSAEPLPRPQPDGSNKEESRCNWPRY